MTQEEGNRLIAEYVTGQSRDSEVFFDLNCAASDLKYHSDWNWLMPVVEKCLFVSDEELDNWEEHYENIDDAFYQVDIDEVWGAVVEFIKWYNTQEHD